jgi:Tfp pilus assembly protein PilO
MGPRERLIATVAIAIIIVAAMWIIVVTPKRNQAANLRTQITAEQALLTSAQQQLAAAEQARSGYVADVHSEQALTRAVPTSDEIPQLIELINKLEVGHHVTYTTTGFGTAAAGDLPSVNLEFNFVANYVDLQKFLNAFDDLTRSNGTSVLTDGRLVSINSITLGPSAHGAVTATVAMTVYQAAASQAAAVGATGASGTTGATGVTAAAGVSQ